MHEGTGEPGILSQTAAAFLTSAAAVGGMLIVYELKDPSSRTRLLIEQARELAQEWWIRYTIDNLTEGGN
jgi:hypothetical protein